MCAFEKKRLYLVICCRESVCNAGDLSLILGSGRAPGERNGYPLQWASLVAQLVKNRLQCRRPGFSPWVRKIPWRRERLPIPVFWPGEFHGMYSPWGHKESDTTERLSLFTHSSTFAWRIPWTEEPGRLQSMESERVGQDWATNTFTYSVNKVIGMWHFLCYFLIHNTIIFHQFMMKQWKS